MVVSAGVVGTLVVHIAVSLSDIARARRPLLRLTLVTPQVPGAVVASSDELVLAPMLRAGEQTVAVMVENHVDARPAFGLEQASVVYEVPAEGGITRFLVVFALDRVPAVVGPVRSIRPYFVDWAEEWGAAIFHSGGSPDGLRRARLSPVPNFDEISWNGKYFWRDEQRLRPHNLLTSGALIRQAFEDYKLSSDSAFVPWPEAAEMPAGIEPANGMAVVISAPDPDYCVSYRYQPQFNRYERWLGGSPHRSGNGGELYAKSVVVQEVPGRVLDREGRLRLDVDAGGFALVLANGQQQTATWERQGARTRFLGTEGNSLEFPDGPVWVTVVLDRTLIRQGVGDLSPLPGCEAG